MIDYYKIIDNFYKYRNEDSLFIGTSHYPQCLVCMDSLLIFNFDKGTIKKVEKPRYDRASSFVNYIKGFPTEQTITGDFNGDGKIDTLKVDWEFIDKKIEEEEISFSNIDEFYFVFSDKTIPKLKVFGNLDYTIKNEGDLDGDGSDERGLVFVLITLKYYFEIH